MGEVMASANLSAAVWISCFLMFWQKRMLGFVMFKPEQFLAYGVRTRRRTQLAGGAPTLTIPDKSAI